MRSLSAKVPSFLVVKDNAPSRFAVELKSDSAIPSIEAPATLLAGPKCIPILFPALASELRSRNGY